jgi:hypothetical protein
MRAEIPQVTALFPDSRSPATALLALVAAPLATPALALSGVPGVSGDPAGSGALPVLPALAGLLPAGLPRGSVIATGAWGLLCLALAAAASGAGAWCAIAGLPALGVAAAAGAPTGPAPARSRSGLQLAAGGCHPARRLRPGPSPPAVPAVRRPAAQAGISGPAVRRRAGDRRGLGRREPQAHRDQPGMGGDRVRPRPPGPPGPGRGGRPRRRDRPRTRWLWLPGPDGSVAAVVSSGIAASSGPAAGPGWAGSPWAAASSWDPGEPAETPLWRGRSAG